MSCKQQLYNANALFHQDICVNPFEPLNTTGVQKSLFNNSCHKEPFVSVLTSMDWKGD